jgi:DNA-binding XRE family transcriptional regulator
MLFRDFRDAYPDLWRRGSDYQLIGYMSILVSIPAVGKLKYEYFGDKITWLERWEDPRATKRLDEERRRKDYSYFQFAVQDKMDELGLSQGDVADITGYSRKSINAYLTGRSIPKLSTMIDITEALGIEDF